MNDICTKCGTAFPRRGKRRSYCNPCRNVANMARRARLRAEGTLPPTPTSPYADMTPAQLREALAGNRHARQYWLIPERRARQAVRAKTRHAIARGDLVRQPCEVCGALPVEAHHDDYSKPLDVRWLCPTHHREHHHAERMAA